MKFMALLALCALTFVGGCKTVAQIPDDQFANGINVAAYNSTYYGFKAVLDNNPGRYAQLAADVKTTTGIIRANVLPVFSGASTGDVLVGAVDTALKQLSVSSTVTNVVKIALAVVETQVHLPTNPAEKLDNRTKMALLGFFKGVADGLDQAVKDAAPSPAPDASTAPAAPVAPATKLQWNNK